MADEERRATALGKEVLLDGLHLADAVSELAAMAIADALEFAGASMPFEAEVRIMELVA
jgi:hypothetical protein